MSNKKAVRIISKTGVELVIDKKDLAKIIIPGIVIREKYYRLVLDMEKDLEKQIKKLKRKAL